MKVLADLEDFVHDHRPHGLLTADATEPGWNGYLLMPMWSGVRAVDHAPGRGFGAALLAGLLAWHRPRRRRMHRKGFDLQLTQYERGWCATFYTTGMEHSPTSATGTQGVAYTYPHGAAATYTLGEILF